MNHKVCHVCKAENSGAAPPSPALDAIENTIAPLYRFALLTLGNRQKAESAVQGACISAYRQMCRDTDEEEAKVLLFSALYRDCRHRLSRYCVSDLCDAIPNATAENKQMFFALQRLRKKHHSILVLRFACGLTNAQAQAATGLKQEEYLEHLCQSATMMAQHIKRNESCKKADDFSIC